MRYTGINIFISVFPVSCNQRASRKAVPTAAVGKYLQALIGLCAAIDVSVDVLDGVCQITTEVRIHFNY